MTERNDNLLDDIFSQTSPESFREALLGEMLRAARRRRRLRTASRLVAVVALLAADAFAIRMNRPADPRVAIATTLPPYTVIRTCPAPADTVLSTPKSVSCRFVTSLPANVTVSTVTGGYHLLDDRELLALIAPKSAILIHTGPDSEILIVADGQNIQQFP